MMFCRVRSTNESLSSIGKSCRPQLARCGFFASQRRRNGRIDEGRRGFDRGHYRCGLEDGATEAFRDVAGHGLPRGLAVLVSRFPSMAVEEDPQGDREAADGEDPLYVVGRPGPPELLEWFDVVPGVGERSQDRHEAERDAEDDEDGPGSLEGSAFRWLLGSGVPKPGAGRHAAAF